MKTFDGRIIVVNTDNKEPVKPVEELGRNRQGRHIFL